MLKIPPIQKRERKWLQRSESTMYFYKKKYTEMDAMSMNLLTVPLHISKNDELYSYRYARDTRTFSIGTNTSYTEYNNVTLFKFKHGFIILLIGNKIIYYCLHFNNIIELIIQSHINNPIVLLDGIMDVMYNRYTTVLSDSGDNYYIFDNGKLINMIRSTNMIDLFSFEGILTWDSPTSFPKIYDVHFLWIINRWLIETSEYIFILDKEGYQRFMTCKTTVMYTLLNEKNDYDGMIYDYDKNAIYVTHDQEYVYYQKNGNILLSQTTYPYHMKCIMHGHILPRIQCWYEKHQSFDLFFHTATHRCRLGMFPV